MLVEINSISLNQGIRMAIKNQFNLIFAKYDFELRRSGKNLILIGLFIKIKHLEFMSVKRSLTESQI